MANGSLIITEPVSTKTRKSAGPRGHRRRSTSFVDGLLILVGCAAFVISRNVASNSAPGIDGGATIDDIRFWLVGLFPIGLMFGLAVVLAAKDNDGYDWLSRRFIAIWIVTLGVFCISRDFQLYKFVYQYIQIVLPFGRSLTEFGTAAVLSMVATALVLIFTALPYLLKRSAAATAFLAAWFASSVMLYGMLLRSLPPS
jgi:hypothetical protein